MIKIITLSAIIICLEFLSGEARIINIPADYATIQTGIDASINGDTVLVAPGTYFENINFGTNDILLCSRFLFDGDTTDIGMTIIDGDSTNTVAYFPPSENLGRLEGFTIRHGRAQICGGGIYVRGRHAIIRNNIITNNIVTGFGWLGGGIAITENSNCLVDHNWITNNRGGTGGGIYCGSAVATIEENIIQNNEARFSGEDGWGGGGIYCSSSAAVISGNLFLGNSADIGGGGIKTYSDIFVINNVLFDNIARDENEGGGAVDILYTHASIANCILWNNGGNEIHAWSSQPTVIYNDIQGGFAGEGNIDTYPLFRDTSIADFYLMSIACGDSADSPCIDAGIPDSLDQILDCLHGLGTTRSDMGAYGGNNSSQLTGIHDYSNSRIPDIITLSQNYPNPFNGSTTINYFLAKAADVRINIFDILGRKIETLSEGFQSIGSHRLIWNGDSRPSGIYFYRIQAGNFVETKKMLLVK